jgi:hypothetical protein
LFLFAFNCLRLLIGKARSVRKQKIVVGELSAEINSRRGSFGNGRRRNCVCLPKVHKSNAIFPLRLHLFSADQQKRKPAKVQSKYIRESCFQSYEESQNVNNRADRHQLICFMIGPRIYFAFFERCFRFLESKNGTIAFYATE